MDYHKTTFVQYVKHPLSLPCRLLSYNLFIVLHQNNKSPVPNFSFFFVNFH